MPFAKIEKILSVQVFHIEKLQIKSLHIIV